MLKNWIEMNKLFTQGSDNVFADLGFDTTEAASLKVRSDLMIKIEKFISNKHWTQAEAAKRMGVTQPRISDLVRGKIELFSSDTLLEMLHKVGVELKIEEVVSKQPAVQKSSVGLWHDPVKSVREFSDLYAAFSEILSSGDMTSSLKHIAGWPKACLSDNWLTASLNTAQKTFNVSTGTKLCFSSREVRHGRSIAIHV